MAKHDNESGWFKSAEDNKQYAEKVNAAVDAYRRGEITTADVHEVYHNAAEEHLAK